MRQVPKGVLTIEKFFDGEVVWLAVMAGKLRVEYEGAIYHLINRGDRREPIFRGDLDRWLFLETLGETCARTDWQVHAHYLMDNPARP